MGVRECRDRTVSERKTGVLAKFVEAVLRRHAQGNARQRSGELPVDVGVHEMCVEDRRPSAREVSGETQERERIDIRGQGNGVERNPPTGQLSRKVPGTRLVLMQHQEADVPAPLLQSREQRQQVRFRARDPGHLLQVQHGAALAHRAAARTPSAQVPTECRCATRLRNVCPISARSPSSSAANQRRRSARLSGESRSKSSG